MRKEAFADLYDTFRFILIRARQKAGLKQAELAEKLNRPQTYVSRYETGERRLDVIEFMEVTDVLGIDPHEVINKLKREYPGETIKGS